MGLDSIDAAIESLPVSYYHYRLLLICGLAFAADAMEVSLLTFLATCAGVEWELSNFAQASITAVVFIGELAGGMFWGPFADRYGRRKCFLFACSLIVIAGFLSGAAWSYESLLFFRAIVGFGVGGLAVPFDLLAEFLPFSQRGRFLMYIEYFWTMGSLFVSGVAWFGLDRIGWRGLALITAVPVTLSSVAAFLYLPESPRWLVVRGRAQEAAAIVRDMAEMSGVRPNSHLPCPSREIESYVDSSSKGIHIHKETFFFDLIRSSRMRQVSLPLFVIWTSFGFTYYGIILYVSRIYSDPNQGRTANESAGTGSAACTFDFQNIFINAFAEFFGVFLAISIVDPWGRTRTQSVLYAVGGVAVLLMGTNMPRGALLGVSLVARLCAMGSSCATWVATPELYPTEMRATGHSVCSSLARVGAFAAPYFVVSSISKFNVGLVLCAINFVAAAVSGFILPETNGAELQSQDVFIAEAAADLEFSGDNFVGTDDGRTKGYGNVVNGNYAPNNTAEDVGGGKEKKLKSKHGDTTVICVSVTTPPVSTS